MNLLLGHLVLFWLLCCLIAGLSSRLNGLQIFFLAWLVDYLLEICNALLFFFVFLVLFLHVACVYICCIPCVKSTAFIFVLCPTEFAIFENEV